MATFSDMATLLLTFFVLLLSFANMDIVEFRTMMGSVREAFGVQREMQGDFQARANTPVEITPGGSPANPAVLANSPTLSRLRSELERRGLSHLIEVEGTPRGVALRIRDTVLFESGSDRLRDDAAPLLVHIAEIVGDFDNELAIEGHTDDRPIRTPRFPSNWELSAARATAVLRRMSAAGIEPERMSIAGYAETRPLAPNETDDGRAGNRRVEFIFVRSPDDNDDREPSPSVPGQEPVAEG